MGCATEPSWWWWVWEQEESSAQIIGKLESRVAHHVTWHCPNTDDKTTYFPDLTGDAPSATDGVWAAAVSSLDYSRRLAIYIQAET